MKLTLIQPFLSLEDRYGKNLGKVGPTCEPMGLAYLAAAIRESGLAEVEIIDAAALNYTKTDLENHLKRSKSEIIGLSILTPMYLRAKETIQIVKDILPHAKIVVGGPHVTVFPKITLEENKDIDVAVFGEAEKTIVELLSAFADNKGFSGIKGIAYRNSSEIKINEPRQIEHNIDLIPLPARDLLPMERYRPAPTYFKKLPSYLILSSRGCPFNCAYCSKVSGKVYRAHSVSRVIQEMEILINDYNAKDIIFRDDTFTVNRAHTVELCNEIIARGLNKKVHWSCMTRVNLVDKEILMLMKKAGCWSIHFGVESGSQRLLNLIEKGITIEQIRKAFKWTRGAGIETKAFFMLGLPTETREESMQTIMFSKELEPDWVQFTITVPYPGTKLYDIALKDKTLKSFKWEDYQTWAGWSDKELVYVTEGRTADELKELQRYAMRSFYLRPKFIFGQIRQMNLSRIGIYFNGFLALAKSGLKK